MVITFNHIIAAGLTFLVIVIIVMGTHSAIVNNGEAIVRLCNFVPAVCPDDSFSDESTFIKYFNVEPGSGNQIRVQWLLVKPSSGEELDYSIYYNSTGEQPKKANGPVVQKNGYKEMIVQLDSFEPQTISLRVSKEDNPELDREELVWEFMPDYLGSRREFILLNIGKISDEILHQGNTRAELRDYKLEKGLRIVGFNKGTAFGACYGTQPEQISAPGECGTETCLCLCENYKGNCNSDQRLCFVYEDVDYFISDEFSDGAEVNYSGVGDVNYFVKHYYCNSGDMLGLNGDTFRISAQKIIREGKTFIKIVEV